jgi:class 3 adenylate cyclase
MPSQYDVDLRGVPLFAGVPDDLIDGSARHDYRTGDHILRQGSQPERMVLLVRGSAEVRCGGTLLTDRHAVCVLGEQALVEDCLHTADVIARGAVVTAEFDRTQAARLLADARFQHNLLIELSGKLRQATTDRAYRYASEEKLFPAFRSHVSAEVLAELMASGIDGSPRLADAAILFTDVRDFTRLTSSMPPAQVAAELGAYLDLGVEVVQCHGGIVDKFIGDAIMAIWAYPEGENHAEKAVAAARDLIEGVGRLQFGGEPLRVGVGIDIGTTFLGTVGSEGKRQFTALGAVPNRAARAESENKNTGTVLCVTDSVYARLHDRDRNGLIDVGRRPLKGFGDVQMWGLKAPEEL